MSNNQTIGVTSSAVIAQIGHIQAVITRMASNSSACKTGCITLVSAILVLIAGKNKPELALLAVIPTLLFLFLDTYYLALERSFRGGYNNLLEKISQQSLTVADLYQIKPDGKLVTHFFSSLLSPAIYPFYMGLLILIFIAKSLVFGVGS